MRIAILTPTFSEFSGIDRVVEQQAKELINKGHKVTIFTLRAGLKLKDVKLYELGMPKSTLLERIYRLLFFFYLPKIIKFGKKLKNFDIVISHFYPMNLLALYAKTKYKLKYIYYNHGVCDPKLFSNPFERIYMHLFKLLNNLTLRYADEVISISNYLKNVLKKETGVDSKVVYNKIDQKRFNKNIDGSVIRKKYNLNDRPICLYVGRISPHKGLHLLIEAFNLVLKEIPNAILVIVGKPTFNRYFRKLKKNRSIIFAGFVSDQELPYYYAACDVYVTASLWEGFNLTVAEAQACGKPTVAFDIGAHPEVVKYGILVKKYDIKGFAKAIIKLIKKPSL